MVRQFLHKQGQRLRQRGQALVEFALAATLIFLLLAAAIDLGMMFFALQGLHNAAQEGATYGSRWLLEDPSTGNNSLDFDAIRERVRHESGDRGGMGFVNLLDLDNNGVPDVSPDTAQVGDTGATYDMLPDGATRVIDDYIQIRALLDADRSGAPEDTPCTNEQMNQPKDFLCFIEVTVSTDYNLVFGLSPAFGEQRRITSRYLLAMRNTTAGRSDGTVVPATRVPTNTPIVATETPEPSATPEGPIFVQIYGVPTGNVTARNQLKIGATAYDTRAGQGASDSAGISRVYFKVYKLDGSFLEDHSEGIAAYCAYGGDGPCNSMSQADWDVIKNQAGTYTIEVYATSSVDGAQSRSEFATFVIP